LKLDDDSKISLPMIPSGTLLQLTDSHLTLPIVVLYHETIATRFKLATAFLKKKLENRLISCNLIAKKRCDSQVLCLNEISNVIKMKYA